MEQPKRRLRDWKSWEAELGEAAECWSLSRGPFDCLGPRETELHARHRPQTEREQLREGGEV